MEEPDYTPSKIELAKALREVKAIASPEQYAQVCNILASSPEGDVGKAIEGLTEEDEFALLCFLMGTATQLAPIEQRLAVSGGHAAPDFLVRFQPGYSSKHITAEHHIGFQCFVEVKATVKDKLSFGGNQLRKLRAFADAFGFPLLLAVRFRRFNNSALWVIVEDRDRDKQSLSVTIDDWIKGIRPVLWNEHGYLLIPGAYFQATYGGEATGKQLYHRRYGEQIEFQIVTPKKRFTLHGDEASISGGIFESYALEEVEIKQHGALTYVLYKPHITILSVADLIYGMNRLSRGENGNFTFDAARTIRKLADRQSHGLTTREFVEFIADRLCHIGVLGRMGYGDPEEGFTKWLATGGKDPSCQS